jgi:S1-C subfamily serine protease
MGCAFLVKVRFRELAAPFINRNMAYWTIILASNLSIALSKWLLRKSYSNDFRNVHVATLLLSTVLRLTLATTLTAGQLAWAASGIPDVPSTSVAPPKKGFLQAAPRPGTEIELEIFDKCSQSVVLIHTQTEHGTGFGAGSILSSDGLILTNFHVVEDGKEWFVTLKPQDGSSASSQDDKLHRAVLVAADPVHDLALLKMQGDVKDLVPIALGSIDEVHVGQVVHAIGHPKHSKGLLPWTYTTGSVTQLRPGEKLQKEPTDYIQMQTPISEGNSGGPLLTDEGKMIGVNTLGLEGGGSQNINFAVAVSEVKKFLVRYNDRDPLIKPSTQTAKAEKKCEPRALEKARSKRENATITSSDFNCSGKVNRWVLEPDDRSKPLIIYVDTNGDEKYDARYYDNDRDGRIDISYHDVDFDEQPDYIGVHPDGSPRPTSFVHFRASYRP